MNRKLLAGLIRFFKFSSLLTLSFLLFCWVSIGLTQIRMPGDIPPEVLKKVEEAVRSFRKPLPPEEYQKIIKKTEEEAKTSLDQGQERQAFECGSDSDGLNYFFSFSMPEEVILGAMREAVRMNKLCGVRVRLILRGFVDNDFKKTVGLFYRYLRQIGEDIPIEIDPELFEEFGVEAVPEMVLQKDGKVGRIRGDLVGVRYALSRFNEEIKDYGLYGRTYPVLEPNFLQLMASKQKEIEDRFKARIPEIRKRALTLNKYDGQFEHAKEDRVYYINPKVVLAEDIRDHQGRVLFKKGSVFNPADVVKLGRYIIIDGNSKKQVEFALKGDYRKIILISGDLEYLVKTYKRQFFFANDELLRRFKIKKVPAIVEGDGEHVRITEKAV